MVELENIITKDNEIEILPLEEYTKKFSKRYKREEVFRDIVHKYLHLGRINRTKLALGKTFRKNWYEKKTDELIHDYAERIREDLEKAIELKKVQEEMNKVQEYLDSRSKGLAQAEETRNIVEQQYQTALTQKKEAEEHIEETTAQKIAEEEIRKNEEAERIKKETDIKKLVQEKLEETIKKSTLIKVSEDGVLAFDEEKMVSSLEDMFLKETLDVIDKEDGKTGFLAKMKADYNGFFSYIDDIEDLSELQNVDWVESAIHSAIRGYRVPTFPYLRVGKPGMVYTKGRTSLDSAIIFDTSGSMNDNNRFIIAKKTALSLKALMRKMNPNNETYLGNYDNQAYDLTSKELFNMNNANMDGFTRTDLALPWLLQKLQGKGLSMAYLITDGAPNDLQMTINAAKEFAAHPQIMLRIFLIDGNTGTEDNIRQIGRAAGNNTKVSSIKGYELAGGVIRDVSKSISEMYDVMNF